MIDKRKNYYIIFDTETAGEEENGDLVKHIYDIGYTIATKKEIVLKRNWLVKEIFTDIEEMKKAYYYSKMPLYMQMLNDHKITIAPFAEIIKQLQKDIKDYNVKFACAYNIGFDLSAFMETTELIYPKKFKMLFAQTKSGKWRPDKEQFFNKYIAKANLEILDIWTMACQTLCCQKTFQTYYLEETPRGNIKSNAEIVYNYITDQDGLYEEEHTALSDSIIETEILQRILRNRKKLKTKYAFMPFRLIERI